MSSKALCLAVSEPTRWLATERKAQALHRQLGKQGSVKENEKTSVLKKSVKFLRYNYYLKVTSNI